MILNRKYIYGGGKVKPLTSANFPPVKFSQPLHCTVKRPLHLCRLPDSRLIPDIFHI